MWHHYPQSFTYEMITFSQDAGFTKQKIIVQSIEIPGNSIYLIILRTSGSPFLLSSRKS